MKLLIAVRRGEENLEPVSFHEADTLCMYDLGEKSFEAFPLASIAKKQGGFRALLSEYKIEHVLCAGVYPLAFRLFAELGIQVWKTDDSQVDQAAIHFLEGKQEVITADSLLAETGWCASDCTACSETCE